MTGATHTADLVLPVRAASVFIFFRAAEVALYAVNAAGDHQWWLMAWHVFGALCVALTASWVWRGASALKATGAPS